MQTKITHTTLVALLALCATPALAQTNGYVREQVREQRASSTVDVSLKAEGNARVGTSTPKNSAAVTGKVNARLLPGASTTAEMRLKMYASSTPEKARERVLEKRAQVESIIAAKKLVITNEMFTKVTERTNRAAEKMTTAADRLSSASVSLRTRTVELSAKGVEASTTLAILAQVDARLVTLRASISDLAEDAALAAASSTPRAAWKDTQDMFQEVIKEFHAIRALLHDAVAALKDSVRNAGLGRGASDAVSNTQADAEVNATSTAGVSTSTAQ